MESSFFKKITTTERFYSYFKVGFYGKAFDSTLSGKEFIHRGYEMERISDFTSRITGKYPEAKVLPFSETPTADIAGGPGQCILCIQSVLNL
jgi:hypothetical protein